MDTKIYAERLPWNFGNIALHLRRRDGVDGTWAYAQTLTLVKIKEEENFAPAPLITLRPEDAQFLMDELWRTGLRPTEGTGSAGSLAATERHLADMRSIVFKTPPKP